MSVFCFVSCTSGLVKVFQDVNHDCLMHSVYVSRRLGFPVLTTGDFQASASEMIDSAILHAANFSNLTSTSAATHGDRIIDHWLVSSWAACFFSNPVVAPKSALIAWVSAPLFIEHLYLCMLCNAANQDASITRPKKLAHVFGNRSCGPLAGGMLPRATLP